MIKLTTHVLTVTKTELERSNSAHLIITHSLFQSFYETHLSIRFHRKLIERKVTFNYEFVTTSNFIRHLFICQYECNSEGAHHSGRQQGRKESRQEIRPSENTVTGNGGQKFNMFFNSFSCWTDYLAAYLASMTVAEILPVLSNRETAFSTSWTAWHWGCRHTDVS